MDSENGKIDELTTLFFVRFFAIYSKVKDCTTMSEPPTKAILLVEDNPADIYLTQLAIAECGSDIQLFIVPDGSEALAFLRKEGPFAHVPSPALIILDLHLRMIDGDQILPELRRLPASQALPIVILSGAAKEIEEERCLQLGATAYVQKSLNFYVYFASIKAIVNTWLRQDGSAERGGSQASRLAQ
jgi:two-component system response regulator